MRAAIDQDLAAGQTVIVVGDLNTPDANRLMPTSRPGSMTLISTPAFGPA
jgi:hypothetical protein